MEKSKVLTQMKKWKIFVMICAVLSGLWFMSGYVFAANDISTDQNAPVSVSLGDTELEITGPKNEGSGVLYHYYTFTLENAATVTGTSDASYYALYNSINLDSYITFGGQENINWDLPEGTYLLKISAGKAYTMKLTSTSFNWGNVEIKWGSKFPCTAGTEIPYTVTVAGGDSSVQISDVRSSSGGCDTISDEKTTVKGILVDREGGDHTLSVFLEAANDGYGQKEEKFSYSIKPVPPSCSLIVTENAAAVAAADDCNIEVYKNGKWTTYKASDYEYNLRIKGLKANTKYKYRAYVEENGYKSDYNQAVFYTAHKEKPSIRSVRASDIKTRSYPKEWHSGYYDGGGIWHDGYYTPAYTMTYYKLTVTLAKNPPKGASTYVVINDQYLRAKGRTYTVEGSYKGRPGETEKVYVRFGRDKGYGGLGKYASAKVIVK